MSKKVFDILIKKWQSKTLAHFYILNADKTSLSKEEDLLNFTQNFLKEIFNQEGRKDLFDWQNENLFQLAHQDILTITPSKKKYVVEDFNGFFTFLGFGLYEFSWRFIIVSEAQLLSDKVMHKLLKSLEEPSPNTTILFLNSSEELLLPTIESRAIKFRIISENRIAADTNIYEANNIFSVLKNKYMERPDLLDAVTLLNDFVEGEIKETKLLERIKKKTDKTQYLIQIITEFLSTINTSYEIKDKALKDMNWFRTSERFNLMKEERILSLIRTASLAYNNAVTSIDTP